MTKLITIMLLAVTALLAGCSNNTSVDEHISQGKAYLAKYDYKNAKKEFIETNRMDLENLQALLGLSEIFHNQGRIRHAYQTLKRYNELNPNNPKVHYLIGLTYLRAGKPNKAKEHAIKSLELDSAGTENLILFAQAHRGGVESHKAIEFINQITRNIGPIVDKSIAIGVLYTKLGQTDAAEKELEKALILDPDSSEAYIALAMLYWQIEQLEKADNSFQKSIATAQRYSTASLQYANFKRKIGDIQNARSILESSVEVIPDHIPSLIEIADISLETGEYSNGIERTTQILEIDSGHPGALLLDGKLKLAANRSDEAIVSFRTMTRSFPKSSGAHLQLAIAYLDENQTNKAINHLHIVRSLTPDSLDASILLAGLDIRQSDLIGAIIKLRQFLKNAPDNREVKIFLAETLSQKGSVDEAIEIYASLIREMPENPNLLYAIGHCYMQKGNLTQTRQAFNQALKVDRSHYASLEQLVLISVSLKEFSNAHKELNRYATENETTDNYFSLSGILLLNEGKTNEAEEAFKQAIEKNANNEQAYLRLAQILIDTERHDEAIESLNETINKNPNDINAHMMLGSLFNRQNNYAKAANCFSAAIAIDPDFSSALNNLAFLNIVYFKNLERAYELATRARQLQPNDPYTADTLGWILFNQTKYTWALALISESASKLTDNPEIQYHLGMIHYMLGDQAMARQTFANAIKTDNSFTGQFDCLQRIGILDTDPTTLTPEQIEQLENQLTKNPNDTICLLKLAKIKSQVEPQLSIQLLDTILEINPENSYALIQQAIIHEQLNQTDRAFELAKNAYSSTKDNATVNQVLGRLAYSKNQIGWAATLLTKAIAKAPENDQSLYILAKASFATGKLQTASSLLANVPANFSFQRQANQLQQLIANYETSRLENAHDIQLSDNDPFLALANQAQLLDQCNETQKAQKAYGSLITAYPDFTPAKAKLAISLHHSETYNENAYNITVSAYSADRDNPELKKAMDAQTEKREER